MARRRRWLAPLELLLSLEPDKGDATQPRPRPRLGVKVADRAAISPFHVMEVMKAAAERQRTSGDVLHLEVGQPGTPAPRGVLSAAHSALDRHRLGYTDAAGLPELRERIARHYREVHGFEVGPDRVVVTVGASAGCVLAFLSCFDVGDRVAVTEPGYPCYRNMLEAFGIEVVPIPVGHESRFAPTAAMVRAAGPLDGLVLASPANPTGTVLSERRLTEIVDVCAAMDVTLISDEIYHGLTYEGRATSVLTVSPDAVVVQSFSKYWSMTGWRLGWLVVPDAAVRVVERLAQNLYIAPPTISQLAAIAAFDCHEELEENVARYARNRRILLDGLARAGITRVAPADGAFYVYADVSHLTDDSQELCRRWLAETGVAVTPGIDFDPTGGHRFVRFSYSESSEDVAEAVERLAAWT